MTIEPARAEQLPALLALLESAGLPRQGFADHLAHALVARQGEQLLGCVELELYGEDALLRSLVVLPHGRGSGCGQHLTRAALELARQRAARRVYLLTTTAERYFPRFGFAGIDRAALPASLAGSEELRGACPASAVALVLQLEPG